MGEIIEKGTIRSRGQICIPSEMREEMDLKEGTKVVFVLQKDFLLIKKVSMQTFAEITKPLKEEVKKSGLKESDVNAIIHRFRKAKR